MMRGGAKPDLAAQAPVSRKIAAMHILPGDHPVGIAKAYQQAIKP
jgi:hypothetical protein